MTDPLPQEDPITQIIPLTHAEKLALAAQYFPKNVYFHSEERVFPSDPESYLQGMNLVNREGDVLLSNINSRSLYEYVMVNGHPYTLTPKLKSKHLPDILHRYSEAPMSGKFPLSVYVGRIEKTEEEEVPDPNNPSSMITVTTTNTYTYIHYIFFYTYNTGYNVFAGKFVGDHLADFERITVVLDDDMNFHSIYYGAHGDNDGKWHKYYDPNSSVYVAKGSHAFYPDETTYIRYAGFANDKTEVGIKLEPEFNLVVDHDDPNFNPSVDGWSYYEGKWGDGSVSGIRAKSWWDDPFDQDDSEAPKSFKYFPHGRYIVYFILIVVISIIIGYNLHKWYKKRIDKASLSCDLDL